MFLVLRYGDAALYMGWCDEMGLIDANRFGDADILATMEDLGSNGMLLWRCTGFSPVPYPRGRKAEECR